MRRLLRVGASLVLSLVAGACGNGSTDGGWSGAPANGGGVAPSNGASASGADAGAGTQAGADAGSGAQADAGAGGGDDAGSDSGFVPSVDTTVRVHYPAGTHTIAIRGALAPLDWTTGKPMTSGANDTWTWTVPTSSLTGPIEIKPLLDDATWSRGPNYKVTPGTTVDLYPHFTTIAGTYSRAYDFSSTVLGNTRGIWIYKPPSYDENTRATFPVVYMHDGQNLFDASTSFGGNEWKVDEAMNAGVEDGSIAEAIVIGVENTADRIAEYTPVPDPTDGGGNGDKYLQMLVTELKPKIDATMRTIPDRAHTAMIGSSLGGLITSYAGVTKADTFGLIGAMSPSTWWDDTWIIGEVAKTKLQPSQPLKVYVDSGDSGTSNDDVTNTKELADEYGTVGYAKGATLDYVVQAGGQHNEVYWSERVPGTLGFLLGARDLLP